jgi:hypothetical protein
MNNPQRPPLPQHTLTGLLVRCVCSTDQGEIEHTSESGAGTLMACGDVPADSYVPFLAHLQDLMRSVAARTGDQRSAAGGQQGHQRTPAFVHALVQQALEGVGDERAGSTREGAAAAAGDARLPRGGFTDVGLHTGGLPRSTAWPLVREVFKVRSWPAFIIAAVADCVGACCQLLAAGRAEVPP